MDTVATQKQYDSARIESGIIESHKININSNIGRNMDYAKMKDLQILAILLNTIIPKDDDFLTAEQVEHLHSLRENILWDIAEKYDMDINNGYLDPTTFEFTPYRQKETTTCNN